MDEELKALRTLVLVLLLTGGLRLGWEARRAEDVAAAAIGRPLDLAAAVDSSTALEQDAARRSEPLGADERLDPNTAPEAELDRLPGVGPATAARIVAARAEGGGFRTVDDLLGVSGIGPATLDRMRPHLEVDASRLRLRPVRSLRGATSSAPTSPTAAPLDPNRADAAALQTLPGIGPALAGRWIETRTAGRFRVPDDLLRVPGIGEVTLARLLPRLASPPWR